MPRERKEERERSLTLEQLVKEWGQHTSGEDDPFADARVQQKIGDLIAKAASKKAEQ
jgi:hypothetical protein